MRFARPVTGAILATLSSWLILAGPINASAPATTAPTATFTFPVPGKITYATRSGWDVTWVVEGTGVARQRLIERVGYADANGGCHDATYAPGLRIEPAASPVHLTGPSFRCHRYRLVLLAKDGSILATALSGGLRTLSDWTGKQDLFRPGIFSTQRTLYWCVGASIQMMLNIILRQHDHSYQGQLDYMSYARTHDQDSGLLGTNALGWRLTLNHYAGTTGYHVKTARNMQIAIHRAARRLRVTGHPVGLLVMHGHHAWVMSGFRATADPAVTNDYTVTDVYVEGPLYPISQYNGYDMAPDTRFTTTQLRTFMNRYQAPGTSWDHRFLTVQP